MVPVSSYILHRYSSHDALTNDYHGYHRSNFIVMTQNMEIPLLLVHFEDWFRLDIKFIGVVKFYCLKIWDCRIFVC